MTAETTSVNELRDYYDATDQSAALASATHESGGGEVLVSTSIRLPKALMDQVRARAEHAGLPATTLMRQWIAAHLDDAAAGEQVVSVTDLEQLIAARAHPVSS